MKPPCHLGPSTSPTPPYKGGELQNDYFPYLTDFLPNLTLMDGCPFPLGELVRRFKAHASRRSGLRLWQPNYYEHVIRHENALERIREYVVANPAVECVEFDQFYPAQASVGENSNLPK